MIRQIVKSVSRYVPLPLMAVLECTKVCNLKCPYCRRWHEGSQSKVQGHGMNMTIEKFSKILNTIPTLRQVDWMGEGEPLCNPYFNDMIAMAHRRLIATGLTTNGTLVTRDTARFWRKNGVNKVGVSLDSPIKEEYEKMRPPARFESVINACRLITGEGLFLQLNMVLFQENIENIEKYVALALDVGARRIDLIRPNPYVGIPMGGSPLQISIKNDAIIEEAVSKAKGIEFFQPTKTGPFYRKCTWPFVAPYINICGDIYSCCYMADTPESRREYLLGEEFDIPCSNYRMGGIDSFWKDWFGKPYRQLRRMLRETEGLGKLEYTPTALLLKLKAVSRYEANRFDHCRRCGWRWSLTC
jgi:MoaA/NifB/PqqE/SkfB family radical SAM enzyme